MNNTDEIFDKWNEVKKNIDLIQKDINLKEGNIYLISIGKNIFRFTGTKKILTRLRFSHSSGSMQNFVLASGVDPQPTFSLNAHAPWKTYIICSY